MILQNITNNLQIKVVQLERKYSQEIVSLKKKIRKLENECEIYERSHENETAFRQEIQIGNLFYFIIPLIVAHF